MGVLPVSRSLQLGDAVTAMIAHEVNQPIDDRSERRRLSFLAADPPASGRPSLARSSGNAKPASQAIERFRK